MKTRFAVALAFIAAVALGWPERSAAYDFFYDQNCAQCHGPTRTCSGCHAHGAHGLANKQDVNVAATPNKTSFTPGEEVVVTVTGGYRCGWVRTLLLDGQQATLAQSSGAGGLGSGPDSCTTGGITLRAPAPTQPGTYTWYAGWYGNTFDLDDRTTGAVAAFGPNFRDGPGVNHGRELVPLTINVLAGGAPAGTLSATSLAFPRVKVGATTALTARLQNGGNAVLKVTGITRCDDASAAPFTWSPAAPLSIAPGGEATLSITYQPTVAASSTSCLRLGTNDPANPSIQLGVTGAADPAPAGVPGVALSGSSLSFGTGVLAGTYVKKTFDVQSSGAANLDVSGLAPCAGTAAGMFGFSSPLPGTIAPGEARTVTVSYTPTAAGSHAGCLTVTTSAGAIDVQLTGSAIMPAVTCTSCHGGKENASGAPPSDTSGESAVTRRGVGAHSAHLNTQLSPSTARQAADCTACHQAVPSFTSPLHRDGSTDVPFGGVAKAGGAAPSWNPQAPSCGTVYCHGATMPGGTNTAPGWTHVGAGEAACGKCHGVPPDESTGHPAVTGGLTACVSCHPKVMTAAGTVDPAGKHIDGVVDVATCTTCHGSGPQAAPPKDTKGNTATTALGVGAHLQHVNANAVAGAIACGECHGAAVGSCATPATNGVVDVSFGALANQGTATTWDRTAATCAASYCHGGSGALTGGSATKPVWTRVDGTQASCGSCHGFPPPAPHAQNTSCDTCHPATVKPGGAIDVAGGKHLDGVVEVDSSTMTCSSCHGTPGRSGSDPFIAAAPPTGTNGETATTTRAVGAHLAHLQPGTLSKAYACTDCHNPPTAMDHANGVVEMSFSALAKGTGAPVFNGTTCASTYCHGNFTNGNTANAPSWTGGAAQVGCTSCHGSPPAGTHPANAACGNCHAGYTATTVDPAVHVNGLVEVSQSCTSCHGTSGVNAAPPKDTKGQTATTLVSVGAHQAHATTTLRAAIDCAECHGAAAASYTNTHPDNTVQVTFGALSNSQGGATAWNRTAATCASNYCHGGVAALKGGTATTPVWTRVDGTQKTCGSCHGNPPPASSGHVQRADCGSCHPGYTSSTVNLATHLDGTVEYPAQTCTSCHGSASLVAVAGADANVKAAPPVDTKANTAVTAAGVGVHQAHVNGARSKPVACAECHAGAVPPSTQPIHANGATTVAFGSVSRTGGAAPTYSTTALTCASTFCHGNFTGGAGAAATPAWTAAGALGCTSCHGDPPALPHPQDAACADCHGAGYSTTTVVASTHVDGVVNLTGVHPPGSCTACHGDATRVAVAGADANASSAPPIGSKGETATTARAVGAHAAHLNQKLFRAAPIACNECHAVPAAGDKTHANGTAAVAFGTLAKTGGAAPAWNGTTCATTYCHGGTSALNGGTSTAPAWTGTFTAGASTMTCTSCHGNPPGGTHPVNTACSQCHSGYGDKPAAGGAQALNLAQHLTGVIEIDPLTCAKCHGDAARVAVAGADANVTAAPPLDTRGNAAITAPGVGVHQVHVNGTRSKPVGCAECHVVPSTMGHSDGVVSVAFPRGGSYAGAGGGCASTYCHGNFAGGGGTAATPAWTVAGTLGCTSCHGNPPALPHPQDAACADCHGAGYSTTTVVASTHVDNVVNLTANHGASAAGGCAQCHGDALRTLTAGADANTPSAPPIGSKGETATTARAVGAHAAHLNQKVFRATPIACSECHAVPAAGDKAHANGAAAVVFGALAKTGGLASAWNGTALTCATVYCHGGTTAVQGGTATTPAWTGAFTAGASTMTCASCHGNPPTANGHPQRTDCGTCHAGATSTAYAASTHLDGKVDVVSTLTCSTCHGTSSTTYVAVAGADANVTAAPPVDTKNGSTTTAVGVGVHQVHVNGSRSKPVGCAECHSGAIPTTMQHENGVVTVAFGTLSKTGNVAPAYTTGGGGCASTYCHGNFTGGAGTAATPAWTVAGTLGCTSCHGNPPALPHPQDAACADCHGAGYSTTTVVASTHVDGAVNLTASHAASAAGGCAQCHGDALRALTAGADANTPSAPPIGSKGETATTARAVGAHVAHLNQKLFRAAPIACNECHAVPAAGDKTHANGTPSVAFGTLARTGGLAPAWNGTALTCASVYCHGGTTAVQGGTATTPAWTGTFTAGASTMTCASCHGNPPTANGHVQRTDCGSCHTGATNTAYAAATHVDGKVDAATMTCTSCHGSTSLVAVASADANVKAAPPIDSKGNSATTARGVGVHTVHVNGTRSKPVACDACHAGAVPAPTNMTHSNGTTTVAFGGTAVVGSISTASYSTTTFGCAATYCHGNFTGGAGTVASPAWTFAGTLACTSCHGNPPALPHPQDTACADCHGAGYSTTTVVAATHVDGTVNLTANHAATAAGGCAQCHGDALRALTAGADANTPSAPPIGSRGETATTARAVGAHQRHANGNTYRNPIACSECHTVPAAGDRTHANGAATVAFGTLARTGGITTAAWNTTALSCASTYCHGNFTGGKKTYAPTWTTPAGTVCGTCHGLPPTATEDPSHPAVAAGGSCSGCHAGYNATTAGGTVNLTTHMNGAVDAVAATCTTCHGTTSTSYVAVAGADANVKAAPPVDTKGNGVTTARGVGSHQVHVNGSRSRPVACAECHSGTVPTSTTHSNGTVTVAFGTVARTGGITTAAFSTTALTCASTYCHGNFTGGAGATTTPAWTAAGTLGCTSCHGAPPALPHPQNTSCATCHGAGYSTTTVVAATHLDGAVTLVSTHASTVGCAQCHGDSARTALAGADANVKAAPPIGSKGETATTARAVGAHQRHANGNTYRNPIACSECHTVPAAGDRTHANGTVAVTFGTLARTGGITTAAWNTTALSCASTYCHGNFTGGKKTYAPSWTSPAATVCGTCHGLPPTTAEDPSHPAVAAGGSCSGCHTGYTATTAGGSVNLTNHLNGRVDVIGGESAGGAACSGCHGTIVNGMNGTVAKASKHTLGSDAAADLTATSWTGTSLAAVATTGRSCVSMCHADHPHGTTTHQANVYADATTSTTRAGTKLATDFDSAQTNGGLCTSCHQKPVDANNPAQKPAIAKATFQGTAHDFKSNTVGTTTYTWQYTLHDGGAFQRDCTKCHASPAEGQTPTVAANNSGNVGPHASDFGQLLAGSTNPGTTPASFVCYNCHGDNTTGKNLSGKVLVTDAAKAQGHGGFLNSAATHDRVREAAATYNSGAYSGTNRHANCADCHDNHRAGKTKHTVGPNDGAIAASSPLYGASGVGYTGTMPANWAAIPSANLARVATATAEYQVCFKCHTGWAFGTTPPTGPSTLAETDLAQEWNVNNKSVHPVVNTLANQTGSTAKGLVASQLLAPWNASPGAQTMTCSDCHNTDAASPAAQGPHGSAVRFMLSGTNKAWPYTVAGATSGTAFRVATSETGIGTANGLFCRNCHPQQNSTGSNSLHRNSNVAGGQHGSSSAFACTGCHIRIPHGGKVSRLLVTTNAPARYKVGTPIFSSITKGATKDSYSTSGFPTGFARSCSQHSSTAGAEAW